MNACSRRLPHRYVEGTHVSQYTRARVRFVTTVGQSEAPSRQVRARAGGAVPMRRTTAIAIAALAMALLTGCTGGGQEPAGLSTATTTPSATPEPIQTPTPTGPVDRSDEAAGIVFTNLPDLTGDALSAFDTLTLYEVEERRAMIVGVIDPALGFIASPEVLDVVQVQIDGNAEGGWTIGGVLSVDVQLVDADAFTAHATVCRDPTAGLYTNAGVTYSAAEMGINYRAAFDVLMSRLDETSPWMVESYERDGTC